MTRRWLLTGLLAVYLFGLAVWATPSRYAAGDLAILGFIYVLLAYTLHMGSVCVAGFGRVLAALPAIGLAIVLAWHCRELTRIPDRPVEFAAFTLAFAAILWPLISWSARGRNALRSLGAAAVSAALLAGSIVVVYHQSPTLRWHLLQHNRILGTPAFIALGEPVATYWTAVWQQGESAGAAPSAAESWIDPEVMQPGPSILFVVVDTLRADSLAAYGGDPSLMPNLNAFAADSSVFADVHSNSTYTKASMASIFTGLLPEEHGAVDHTDRLRDELPNLAEELRGRGYETAAFVTNFSNVGVATGFDRGYDTFFEVNSEGARHYARAERVNRLVREWLEKRSGEAEPDSERPLFLYVHYLDPHTPYLAGGGGAATHAEMRVAYDRELTYFDASFPTLLSAAREVMGPDTVVIFTADHGEEFGEHGEHGHGHALYREIVSIPLVVHQPDGRSARVDERLEGRDIFDLTLALARDADLDVARWGAEHARDRRYASIYVTRDPVAIRPYRFQTCMRSIESEDDVLIWSAYGDTVELYDRARDPDELVNLAARKPERVEKLRSSMDRTVEYWASRVMVELDDDTKEQLRQLGYIH